MQTCWQVETPLGGTQLFVRTNFPSTRIYRQGLPLIVAPCRGETPATRNAGIDSGQGGIFGLGLVDPGPGQAIAALKRRDVTFSQKGHADLVTPLQQRLP